MRLFVYGVYEILQFSMPRKRLSKGIRKFIRAEKARIRREISDITEQERRLKELIERHAKNSG